MPSKKIKYESYIDIDDIKEEKGEDFNYRYSLIASYKNPTNTKKVLVIMRNPSTADATQSDFTVNNVLHYCKNKYQKVYFVNLYPHKGADPNSVKSFFDSKEYKCKMQNNQVEIEKLLLEVDDVIVAWGSADSLTKKLKENEKRLTDKLISHINSLHKKIYAVRFTKSENPWHPLNWKKSFDLEMYEWNNS